MSACFVLPLEDDVSKVYEALHHSAVIHKTGGGTGFSFGHLRPKNDHVQSSGRNASGPMAFLRLFDFSTQIVKQGGVRRGANMAILPIDHPGIEEFILSKVNGGIENFNLSAVVSDAFMRAVHQNRSWGLKNPRTG